MALHLMSCIYCTFAHSITAEFLHFPPTSCGYAFFPLPSAFVISPFSSHSTHLPLHLAVSDCLSCFPSSSVPCLFLWPSFLIGCVIQSESLCHTVFDWRTVCACVCVHAFECVCVSARMVAGHMKAVGHP